MVRPPDPPVAVPVNHATNVPRPGSVSCCGIRVSQQSAFRRGTYVSWLTLNPRPVTSPIFLFKLFDFVLVLVLVLVLDFVSVHDPIGFRVSDLISLSARRQNKRLQFTHQLSKHLERHLLPAVTPRFGRIWVNLDQ